MYQNFCTFAEAIIISLIYYILVFYALKPVLSVYHLPRVRGGGGRGGGGVIAKLGCHLGIKGISINYIAALAAFSLVQTIDVVCMHEVVTVKRDAAEIKFQCRMSLLKMLWRRKQKNEKESIMNWEGGGVTNVFNSNSKKHSLLSSTNKLSVFWYNCPRVCVSFHI